MATEAENGGGFISTGSEGLTNLTNLTNLTIGRELNHNLTIKLISEYSKDKIKDLIIYSCSISPQSSGGLYRMWLSGQVGEVGEVLLTNLTNLTNSTNLTNLTISSISQYISRPNRGKGLLQEGLLEIDHHEGNSTFYKATQAGLDRLNQLHIQYMQEQERKELEKKEEETAENITTHWETFLKEYMGEEYQKAILLKASSIYVDFSALVETDLFIAQHLLDDPDMAIACAKSIFTQDDLDLEIRFKNLPKSQEKLISQFRADDINRIWVIQGIVVGASDVRPHIKSTKYECPSCNSVIHILQMDHKLVEPSKCACGRKGKFTLLDKELVDAQRLSVEELPEQLGMRSEPKKIAAILKKDLTNFNIQPFLEDNKPIKLNGILREKPMVLKSGSQSTDLDFYLDIVGIELGERQEISITDQDRKDILKATKEDGFEGKLLSSISPNIAGREEETKVVLLSILSGGSQHCTERDDSHSLLIGDPGTGKSSILARLHQLIPGSRWVSGHSTSGVGLIGAAVKDEFLGQFMIAKGALALAHGNICFVDELDKMREEDRLALHEPLENQCVSIHKANKHSTFSTDCTVIAAANPKNGRFDAYTNFPSQLNLPPTLTSRFDVIVPFIDSREKDTDIANLIVDRYAGELKDGLFGDEFLSKYLFFARSFQPKLSKACGTILKSEYKRLRKSSDKYVSITPRLLAALSRITIAHAKLHCRPETKEADAKEAIRIVTENLHKLGVSDIDVIEVGVSSEQRTNMAILLDLIPPGETVSEEDLALSCSFDFRPMLDKLKEQGEIFEPKPAKWRRL